MKKILIASLIAAQTLAVAEPAFAATLDDQPTTIQQSRGTFAGARLRIPLGGEKATPRAGLAFTAMQRSGASDGSSSLRFSEGVEFGFAGSTKPQLMLAGQPLSATKLGLADDGDKKGGISTLGTVAIVVGGLLVVGAIGAAILAHELEEASY